MYVSVWLYRLLTGHLTYWSLCFLIYKMGIMSSVPTSGVDKRIRLPDPMKIRYEAQSCVEK